MGVGDIKSLKARPSLSSKAKNDLNALIRRNAGALAKKWLAFERRNGRTLTIDEFTPIAKKMIKSGFVSEQYLLDEFGVYEYFYKTGVRMALTVLDETRYRDESRWLGINEMLDAVLVSKGSLFFRNYRAAYRTDDYGNVVFDKRDEEITKLIESIGVRSYSLSAFLRSKIRRKVAIWFRSQMNKKFDRSDTVPENGRDFEHWVAARLNKAGWTATVTKASGDDGVDIISEKSGVRLAVQCKRYSGSVGNKSVQEVYTGMKHMQLDHAVVIGTGKYTKAAQDLARTTGVILLSEHDIPDLFDLLGK